MSRAMLVSVTILMPVVCYRNEPILVSMLLHLVPTNVLTYSVV